MADGVEPTKWVCFEATFCLLDIGVLVWPKRQKLP